MAQSWSKQLLSQRVWADRESSDMHPEFQPALSKAMLAGNMSKWLLWEGASLLLACIQNLTKFHRALLWHSQPAIF